MNLSRAVAILVLLNLPIAVKSQNVAPAEDLVAMGAYVATNDIGRSEVFYRTLFDREPVIRLDDFIVFDISGGWFAVVSRDRYASGSAPGSGAVPYIQSSDLEAVQTRAAAAAGAPAPLIIEEPGIRLLKLHDPDGQLVEFFSLAPS